MRGGIPFAKKVEEHKKVLKKEAEVQAKKDQIQELSKEVTSNVARIKELASEVKTDIKDDAQSNQSQIALNASTKQSKPKEEPKEVIRILPAALPNKAKDLKVVQKELKALVDQKHNAKTKKGSDNQYTTKVSASKAVKLQAQGPAQSNKEGEKQSKEHHEDAESIAAKSAPKEKPTLEAAAPPKDPKALENPSGVNSLAH